MHSAGVIVLLTFVAQANAQELDELRSGASEARDAVDEIVDKLADNLFDKALKMLLLQHVDQDKTTLGKPGHLGISRQTGFLSPTAPLWPTARNSPSFPLGGRFRLVPDGVAHRPLADQKRFSHVVRGAVKQAPKLRKQKGGVGGAPPPPDDGDGGGGGGGDFGANIFLNLILIFVMWYLMGANDRTEEPAG